MTRTLLTILLLLVGSHLARAQFFVSDKTPCPRGEGVEMDTIAYVPNKAMPFDRCFYLTYILKGKPVIKYFAIEPIDRAGKARVRRRDYRVFIRSGNDGRKARAEARANTPLQKFRRQPGIKRLFTIFKTTVKGNTTLLTLEMPPLDPAREYRITLIAKDVEAGKELLSPARLFFRSQNVPPAAPVAPPTASEFRREAALLHHQNVARRDGFFAAENFEQFARGLYAFTLQFAADADHKVSRYKVFWLAPGDSSLSLAGLNKVDTTRCLTVAAVGDPVSVPITPRNNLGQMILPFPDAQGRQIDMRADQTYRIRILAYGVAPPSGAAAPGPWLLEPGKIIFSQRGTVVKAVPDPDKIDGQWLDATKSIMGMLAALDDDTAKVRTITEALPAYAFARPELHYALEQARLCACGEKGSKDLVAQDQLLNALTFLASAPATELRAVQSGLTGLDNPTKRVKSSAYDARRANMAATLDRLDKLLEFLAKTQLAADPVAAGGLQTLATNVRAYRQQVEATAQLLGRLAKTEQAIADSITNQFVLLNRVNASPSGSTSVLELLSESKFRIVPDFGFAALFKGNGSLGLQDFTPYLGFHIGFRPLDKNIPFRLVRYKTWRHRLTFSAGTSLRPLAIENQREDFFTKTSLLTGLGFRLTNFLQFSSGVVWFKAYDPNPLSSRRPVRVTPYAGLAVNLELQELFGGIRKLFN